MVAATECPIMSTPNGGGEPCNVANDVDGRSRNNFEPWTLRDDDLPSMPISREYSMMTPDCIVPFPDRARPLENQLGGHVSKVGKPSIGLLQHEDGHVLKGLSQSGRRGLREAQFYESVFFAELHEARKLLDELREFVPTCLGMFLHDVSGAHHCYLKLENIARGMRLPSSIDCKVGVRITDPLCPPSKLKYMEQKYVGTRKPLGLSLIGVRYYDVREGVWRIHGREYSDVVTVGDLDGLFEAFTNAAVDKRVITCFISRMEGLKDWFERQRIYLFISASLFLCYDADVVIRRRLTEAGGEPNANVDPRSWDPSKVVLKMIDFAHVFPAQGQKDDNFLFGLSNLIRIFRRVQGWGTYNRVVTRDS